MNSRCFVVSVCADKTVEIIVTFFVVTFVDVVQLVKKKKQLKKKNNQFTYIINNKQIY